MRKPMRRPVAVVLLAMMASLLGVATPSTASAAESIPTLRWPAVDIPSIDNAVVSDATGGVTVPCAMTGQGMTW